MINFLLSLYRREDTSPSIVFSQAAIAPVRHEVNLGSYRKRIDTLNASINSYLGSTNPDLAVAKRIETLAETQLNPLDQQICILKLMQEGRYSKDRPMPGMHTEAKRIENDLVVLETEVMGYLA